MAIERIVYGVLHHHDNAERVASVASPEVSANNKVGLEASEFKLELYEDINKKGLPQREAEELLLGRIINEYGYSRTGDDGELSDPLSAALFWYRLYTRLRESGAEIRCLGSEKRIRLLDSSAPYDSHEDFLRYHLITVPHFDRLLTERILEDGFDRIVVGMGHAPMVADKTGSKLEAIDSVRPDLQRFTEALEREYLTGRFKLPDLKD